MLPRCARTLQSSLSACLLQQGCKLQGPGDVVFFSCWTPAHRAGQNCSPLPPALLLGALQGSTPQGLHVHHSMVQYGLQFQPLRWFAAPAAPAKASAQRRRSHLKLYSVR